jgi:hypothetical protein
LSNGTKLSKNNKKFEKLWPLNDRCPRAFPYLDLRVARLRKM